MTDVTKILFVCQANVGRSQAAMELYNQDRSTTSDSAGTKVDLPGQKLSDRPGAANIIEVMREYDIDMTNNIRTQLTEELAEAYDKIIVMAEPETMPEWLKNSPKVEIWTVPDPKGQSLDATRKIVGQIKERIDAL